MKKCLQIHSHQKKNFIFPITIRHKKKNRFLSPKTQNCLKLFPQCLHIYSRNIENLFVKQTMFSFSHKKEYFLMRIWLQGTHCSQVAQKLHYTDQFACSVQVCRSLMFCVRITYPHINTVYFKVPSLWLSVSIIILFFTTVQSLQVVKLLLHLFSIFLNSLFVYLLYEELWFYRYFQSHSFSVQFSVLFTRAASPTKSKMPSLQAHKILPFMLSQVYDL